MATIIDTAATDPKVRHNILRNFINPGQLSRLEELARDSEEKDFFDDKLAELQKLVVTMPKVYEQEGKDGQAVVYLHYFYGSADWYILERDIDINEQIQAFGQADLFGDGGELGYISIQELLSVGAELDMFWTPKTLDQL